MTDSLRARRMAKAKAFLIRARRANKAPSRLKGGAADGKRPSDFDQWALLVGIAHELEHTTDAAIAMEIAMDHLVSDRLYYTRGADVTNRNAPKNRMRTTRTRLAEATTKIPTKLEGTTFTVKTLPVHKLTRRHGRDENFFLAAGKVYLVRQGERTKFIGRATTEAAAKKIAEQFLWNEGRSTMLQSKSPVKPSAKRLGATKESVRRMHRRDLKKGMIVRAPDKIVEDGKQISFKGAWGPGAPSRLVVGKWNPVEGTAQLRKPMSNEHYELNILDWPEYFEVIGSDAQ